MNRNFKEGEPTPTLIRVLWVDDQLQFLMPYKTIVEEGMGGEIEFVSSAQEALEILEKQAEEGFLPDIIISDFTMPRMNGLQFVEAIKSHQNETIRSLPFCIVSSHIIWKDQDKLEELDIPTLSKETALLEPQTIRQFYEEITLPQTP